MSGSGTRGSDFWSRRKAAVQKAEDAEKAERAAAEAASVRAGLEEKTDPEILDELGLPDPDSLTGEDDFSGFLSKAVPERLRRRALRRLWSVNPVLANLDGLLEYGEDYTDAATVIDDLQTVYQVGKGMFDRFAELEDTKVVPEGLPAEVAIEDGVSEKDSLHVEENTAAHNEIVKTEVSYYQLTQGENIGQPAVKHVNLSERLEIVAEMEENTPPYVRRRLRIDYE